MNLKNTILGGSIAILALSASASAGFVPVTGYITTDTRWTRDNVYILREAVYVLPPAKLIIEPGTIVRGVREGSGFDTAASQSPGSLFAARGAKIIANGTADDPIVFTSIDDPNVIGGAATVPATVNGQAVTPRNYNPDGPMSANAFAYDGEWGGLVLLGEGPLGYDGDGDDTPLQYNPGTNSYAGDTIQYPVSVSPLSGSHDIKSGDGVGLAGIEGAPLISQSGVTYTDPFPGATGAPPAGSVMPPVYGGLNRNDNSGVLSFVESRYGGFPFGPANELNGITFGATGTATVAEWLSSYNNADDGFEFFGGYTHFRYMFSLFQGDDGFDGDQGFNGTLQHVFGIVDNQSQTRSAAWGGTQTGRVIGNIGDNVAEWDGSEEVTQGGIAPNTNPYFYNFTFVPSPASGKDGVRRRRGVTGSWFNGLVQDGPDDAFRTDGPNAPNDVLGAGTLTANFNVYSNVADAATEVGATRYSDAPATSPAALAQELSDLPRSTGWGADGFGPGSLDPRPRSGAISADISRFNVPVNRTDSYAYSGWTKIPMAGCMRDNNMLKWTALEYLEILAPGNVARPEVSVGNTGGSATVSFASSAGVGGRSVLYVVERSTNRSVWTPFAIVSDNDGAGTTDLSGTTFATADGNATAGAITVTDPTALAAGSVVYYRVIPQ